jgi:sirohydrochlorin ferrochelatase
MRAVVIVGHGSRVAAANELVAGLAEAVGRRIADPVSYGFLEIAEPTLEAALAGAERAGATEVVLVPCLLAAGRHALEDIPGTATRVLGSRVRWEVTDVIGTHPLLIDIVVDRAGGS